MASDTVTLLVEGMEHRGWKAVRISRGIQACAGKFDLDVSDRWSDGMEPRSIRPGDRCQVLIGDEPLITGYVDDVDPAYDARNHGLRVAGRDRTADLVDCSIIKRPAQWRGRKVEDIARELAAPFGIPVIAGDDTGAPLPEAAAQEGDTVFEFLDKVCKSRNVWPVTDGHGRLTFVRASKEKLPTELARPGLILRAQGRFSDRDRFSAYYGKGQRKGSDRTRPTDHAHVAATVTDDGIRRYRPLLVQGEDQHERLSLTDRLTNERNKRIGDSRTVDVTVPGWRMPNGELWPVNRRVHLRDDWLKLDEEFLVAEAAYELSAAGTTTTLTLKLPIAFDLKGPGFGTRGGPKLDTVPINDRPWSKAGGPV